MKKHLLIILILSLVTFVFAAQGSIKVSNTPTAAVVTNSNDYGLSVSYSIEKLDFQEIQTSEGLFTDLWVADYAATNTIGLPKLPLLRQIFSVPEGSDVQASMNSVLRKNIDLKAEGINNPIIPRQEPVSKSVDPATLPFIVNREFYQSQNWTDFPSIQVTDLGYMRGYHLYALDFTPVRYNPGTGEIEVIYSAEVNVQFLHPDLVSTNELRAKTYSPVFDSMLKTILMNPDSNRASLNRYPMSYLIITPPNFVNALQPFVNWKTQEGYNVIVATTTQTGTTTTSIKNYIQNIWDSATTENPAPTYLLIVGDVAQVPANSASASPGGHVTDLTYVRLQGTDFIPEMYFGRFSATTEAEVTNQVNKTLMHEMYTMPSDAYLSEVVMIAGVDASWSPTHANGQINYGVNNYFNAAHGINSHTYLYPASQNASSSIINDISNGVGYANYTAHGSETSWYSPSFTIANINSLQNVNEYPVVVGNCCLTNAFDTGVCFGEAWLRAENKGAVSYIGGTNSTYWDEDYYWAVGYKPPIVGTGSPFVPGHTGAYDAMFHEHNEPFEDWGNSVGAIIFMGNMAVVQANSPRINYYWEIYSNMGDPSLIPYLGIPAQNSFVPPATLFLGLGSLDITADPYTYVAISMNNELHGVGLTDASGNLTLNFTPFTEPGTAQLVLTRSLRRPMIANIQVIPNVGPYVTVSQITVNDPNANAIAEAGETISMNLTFHNVGVQPAANLTATLSTTCPYVTILDGTATLPDILPDQTISLEGLFSVLISIYIPDQTSVPFDIIVSDGTNTWTTTRSIVVNAPKLQFGDPILFDPDGDGFFEPGENISIGITITNVGHMNTDSGTLIILVNNPFVTLSSNYFVLPTMAAGVNIPINFTVSLAPDIPDGIIVPISLSISAGQININHCILLPIGVYGDGFETGDFSVYPWVNNSPIPWTVVNDPANAHSGNYVAKSGAIGHSASTELSVTLNVSSAGNIKFWRKVSSELNYDFLRFSIDGEEKGSWSGTLPWAQFSYPVTTGPHTFKWTYSKDSSVSSGSDCAWIDDITFPISASGEIAIIYVPQTEFNFLELHPNDQVSADIVINNVGTVELTGTISYPSVMNLFYNGFPVENDHNFSIPVGEARIYTLTYTAPETAVNLDLQLIITSNDINNSPIIIPIHITTVPNNDPATIPVVTSLEGNYPNPFNPETAINFSLKESGKVRINIYNLKGQLVRQLLDTELPAGRHQIVWNGKDNQGRSVSSGIYLYRMEAKGYTNTKKMMLMK